MVGRSLVVLPEVLLMLARLREEVKGLERASWVVRRNMFGEGMEGESECVCVYVGERKWKVFDWDGSEVQLPFCFAVLEW